jgi:hypothetical protein
LNHSLARNEKKRPFADALPTAAEGTSFTWTPDNLPSGTYAFRITDESGEVNYSMMWSYQGTGELTTSSSATLTTLTTRASTSTTTASSSTETETTEASSTTTEASTTTSPSVSVTSKTTALKDIFTWIDSGS